LLVKIFDYYHSIVAKLDEYDSWVDSERYRYLYAMSKIAACKRLYKCAAEAHFSRPEGFHMGFSVSDGTLEPFNGYYISEVSRHERSTFVYKDIYFRNVTRLHLPIQFYHEHFDATRTHRVLNDLFYGIEVDLLRCEKLAEVNVYYNNQGAFVKAAEVAKRQFLTRVKTELEPKLQAKSKKLGRSLQFRAS